MKGTDITEASASAVPSLTPVRKTCAFLSFKTATESWDRKKNPQSKACLWVKQLCWQVIRIPRSPRASDGPCWLSSLGPGCWSHVAHRDSHLAGSGTCLPKCARVGQREPQPLCCASRLHECSLQPSLCPQPPLRHRLEESFGRRLEPRSDLRLSGPGSLPLPQHHLAYL